MRKLLILLLLFSNSLVAQESAIVIKRIFGDKLLSPVVLCNDSIETDFRNKYLKVIGVKEGLPINNISYSLLDSSKISVLSDLLSKEIVFYERFNNADSLKPFGLFELIYIDKSKVVWKKTLHHYQILELVLYRTALNLYYDKPTYNIVTYHFLELLLYNSSPPK